VTSRRSRQTRSLMTQWAELAFAVPQVVAHRVTRMAIAGSAPSARDRREFELMSAEKTAAFNESWNAMAVQTMRANQALALSMLRSLWIPGRASANAVTTQLQNTALAVLGKGMAPVHRKATANARRLARTKLR